MTQPLDRYSAPPHGSASPGGPIVMGVSAPELVADPLLDRFDLGYLWRRYWKRIVLLPVLGAALGLGAGFVQEPLYESTALLLVDPDYERAVRYDHVEGANRSELEALKSIEVAIAADSVLLRALNRLDLRSEEGFLPKDLAQAGSPDLKVLKFLRDKRISTSLVPETRLIRIRVRDPLPARAQRLAEALCKEFELYLAEQRRSEIEATSQALEAQAALAREVALNSDRRLNEFRQQNPEFPVEQEHELFASRLTQFGEQLNAAIGQRLNLESQREAIEGLDPETEALEIIQVAGYTAMPHVSALLDSLSASRSEFSGVREQYTEQHPNYRIARAKVARNEAELTELARNVKAAINSSYLAEKSREGILGTELENAKSQFAEMKVLSSEFRALQQQSERDWSVHQALQTKLSESAVAMERGGQIATMVSEPMLPYKPAQPVLPLYVLVGGAVGGVLAFGGIAALVLSGLPFSNSRQIEQRLGLPVIADWSVSKKLPAPHSQSPALLQYLGGNRHKAIQVSAPELNGVGESVAKKVAIAAAQNGRQTLLILIKPGRHEEKIQSSEFTNLSLLEIEPELVRDPTRFAGGLKQLMAHFDNIFIEAGEANDPELVNYLSSLADQDLLVVGKGKSRKQLIYDRVTRLSRPGAPPVGLILVSPE